MRLNLYEIIKTMFTSADKEVLLVQHKITSVFYVMKVIRGEVDISIYEQLKRHPHPNFANVVEYMQTEDDFTLIEEFINGSTLEEKLSTGKIDEQEIMTIMMQLFDVLAHLHALTPPLIHRDIKPANIMLTNHGVKLIDFEIARIVKMNQTKDTMIIGSVGYAAPEQYGFGQSDTRSDIFALGVLLNEMYTMRTEMNGLMTGPIAAIIKKSIAMDPNNRYQSIKEMRKAYETIYQTKDTRDVFRIPGFQGETKRGKMLIFLYYLFCIYFSMSISIEIHDHAFGISVYRITYFLLAVSFLWVPKNVANILHMYPLVKSKHSSIRALNVVLVWFSSVFILLFICVILIGIYESML